MDLKINFNNPHILRGHLEQAIPQILKEYKLEEMKALIEVGRKGGLAYRLFDEDISQQPTDLKDISIMPTINAVMDYFGAVKMYIMEAERLAHEHGDFNPVSFDPKTEELTLRCERPNVYHAGVGSTKIESLGGLQDFLEMVKEVHPRLRNMYFGIRELARPLLSRQRD